MAPHHHARRDYRCLNEHLMCSVVLFRNIVEMRFTICFALMDFKMKINGILRSDAQWPDVNVRGVICVSCLQNNIWPLGTNPGTCNIYMSNECSWGLTESLALRRPHSIRIHSPRRVRGPRVPVLPSTSRITVASPRLTWSSLAVTSQRYSPESFWVAACIVSVAPSMFARPA